ncbi:potassium channel family protein [Vibrio splendidus]|uniref:potassium channel family protein n=1 Tax=Vibrio splendidus TaxID=29497 RepID=UPI000C81B2EF|nr:potassium channel family protein [Vibrio splendidus]PMM11210.1 potassium channel related protein [Vibrio splendidus]PMN31035.1 potassium channel related protein [Vibrio splendidus]
MKKYLYLWDKYVSVYIECLTRVNILMLAALYITVTYFGFSLSGEHEITSDINTFLYFIFVTASTIGYGDMSPSGTAGRWFTIIWVIPFSLILFGLVLGKAAAFLSTIWYRRLRGKHMLSMDNHIVVIGFNRERTPHLVRMLRREEKGSRDIVLVSVEQQENPLDGQVHFVNASSFTEEEDLQRANITNASCIVVDTDSDEYTLTIALFVSALNSEAHLVAHFLDDVKCMILNKHIPNAECISNLSTELLAKSIMDSGSSLVHSELVSAHKGQTQYSIEVPSQVKGFNLSQVFLQFKQQNDATIIGLRRVGEHEVAINVHLDSQVNPGDQIYYIADERVKFADWPEAEEC